MSVIDYDELSRIITIKESTRRILDTPERRMQVRVDIPFDDTEKFCNAYVVYHSTARGHAKGGIRFDREVTLEETCELAERMDTVLWGANQGLRST